MYLIITLQLIFYLQDVINRSLSYRMISTTIIKYLKFVLFIRILYNVGTNFLQIFFLMNFLDVLQPVNKFFLCISSNRATISVTHKYFDIQNKKKPIITIMY